MIRGPRACHKISQALRGRAAFKLFEENCNTLPPTGGSGAVATGEGFSRSQKSKHSANRIHPLRPWRADSPRGRVIHALKFGRKRDLKAARPPREGRKRACEFPGRGCAKWLGANPLSPLPEGSFLAFDPPEGG